MRHLACILLSMCRVNGFGVAWNSPWPSYCAPDTVNPKPDFKRFDIDANRNAAFNGDTVWTIYCPTYFKTFPTLTTAVRQSTAASHNVLI